MTLPDSPLIYYGACYAVEVIFVLNLCRNGYIGDAIAHLNDKPDFDVNALDDDKKLSFLATVEFVKSFKDYLPDAGVIA